MYILESLAFMQNFIMDSFMFEICMYTFSFDKAYIYLEAYFFNENFSFDDFHVLSFIVYFMNLLFT